MMMHEFFAIAVPGLEETVRSELARWAPEVEAKVLAGGVRFLAPRPVGLGLNLALKTPTRILWRLARFRARDFPRLYQKVRALPWGDLLAADVEIEVKAAARRSRLKIKDRIEATCREAVESVRGKGATTSSGARTGAGSAAESDAGSATESAKRVLTLFVRLEDDECTLSLDTSGERLHKRGVRILIGEAPLRETLAAALIELVSSLPGSGEPAEIFDPMVGSGTFLLEAAGRFRVMKERSFAFEALRENEVVTPRPPGLFHPRLVGWDREAKTLALAQRNLGAPWSGVDASGVVLETRDVFTAEPLAASDARWVFMNPPYGERLKVAGPLSEYYARLIPAVMRASMPLRACFLLAAAGVKGKFALPPGYRALAKVKFINGGIPVIAFVVGR